MPQDKSKFEKFCHFFYHPAVPDDQKPTPIQHEQYLRELSIRGMAGEDRERAERAFNMVVRTREFEIELYWKRVAYFWAFLISIFAGYVSLFDKNALAVRLILVTLGFVFSLAWVRVMEGSKVWQRHWEKHLDLLEDPFVGPLYKTVYPTETYSVSKINEIVGWSAVAAWPLIGAFDLINSGQLYLSSDPSHINYRLTGVVVGLLFLGFAAFMAIHFGYGRGRFKTQSVTMHRRAYRYGEQTSEPSAQVK